MAVNDDYDQMEKLDYYINIRKYVARRIRSLAFIYLLRFYRYYSLVSKYFDADVNSHEREDDKPMSYAPNQNITNIISCC